MPSSRYFLTLRLTLFFETPNVWMISLGRQLPWHTNWALNIRNEARSSSPCSNTGWIPQK